MAVISKEDLIKKFNSFAGENATDEALSFLEDLSDTFSDYETKTKDTTNWQAKYTENDKMWREKYKARFSQPVKDSIPAPKEEPALGPEDEPLSYEGLFKTN